MTELRRGLPPLPARIAKLPLDSRGYPIPWFVETLDDGTRDFRVASAKNRVRAVKEKLCWICGEKLGRHLAFPIGPMCAVNRNTSEPPCHLECAEFAARACPFLILPKAQYRTANLPEGGMQSPHALPGNPGAVCIWITQSYKPYRVPDHPTAWLIQIGEPEKVLWFTEGRPACRAEIMSCLHDRLPFLMKIAQEEGPLAVATLAGYVEQTVALLPPKLTEDEQ